MAGRKYEREADMPANWTSNTILVRDAKGEVVEVNVPDDPDNPEEEVEDDAGND